MFRFTIPDGQSYQPRLDSCSTNLSAASLSVNRIASASQSSLLPAELKIYEDGASLESVW